MGEGRRSYKVCPKLGVRFRDCRQSPPQVGKLSPEVPTTCCGRTWAAISHAPRVPDSAPRACPRVAAAPAARTPELSTLFSTFHSIPPPVTSFRKQKPPGPALKRPRTSWPLKGPRWPREGRGLGTAAQPLCGQRRLSPGPSLPPRPVTGQALSGVCARGKSLLPITGGAGDSSTRPPHPSGLFWCHVDEIIRLAFSGVLLSLLVSLTQRISQMRLGKKYQASPRTLSFPSRGVRLGVESHLCIHQV